MLHGYVSFKISAGVLWGQAHTVVDGRVGGAELWSGRVWAPGHRLHGGLVSPRSAGIARVDGCGAGGRRVRSLSRTYKRRSSVLMGQK